MTQLKLNTCGKHYGKGGPCSKCAYFSTLPAISERDRALVAAIRPASEYDAQERAIAAARGFNPAGAGSIVI